MINPAKVTRPWNDTAPSPVMGDFKEIMTGLSEMAARHGFIQTTTLRRELIVGLAVMVCLVAAINDSQVTPLVPANEGPPQSGPAPYRFPDNTVLQEFMGFPILLDTANPNVCLVRLILPNDTIVGIDLKGVIGERPAAADTTDSLAGG